LDFWMAHSLRIIVMNPTTIQATINKFPAALKPSKLAIADNTRKIAITIHDGARCPPKGLFIL
jgi:hypothetical protein